MKGLGKLSAIALFLLASTAVVGPVAIADDVINLRMTALTGASGKGTQAVIEEWNKRNPNIQVAVEIQADELNWQKTAPTTMFAGDDGPDLSWWWCTPSLQYKDMIAAKQLATLDDVVDKANYPAGTLKYYTEADGHTYGINSDVVWTPFVYYNKEIFAKAGVEPPKTWDELYALSQKVRAAGFQPMVTLYDFGMVSHLVDALTMRTWTEDEYNAFSVNWSPNAPPESLKYKWTDPGGVRIFQALKEIAAKGFASDGFAGLTDSEVAKSLFTSGKAAMYQSGSWDVNGLKEASKFDVGFFFYPPINEKAYGPVGSWVANCFVAFNKPNLEAAKKVLAFITSREGAVIYSKASGLTPGRTDVPAADLSSILAPMSLEMVSEINKQGAPALIEAYIPPDASTALKHSADLVLTGQATPEEAAKLMEEAYEKLRKG